MEQIKVWFVTPEAAPFAKTGGLADVAGSLPRALKDLGIDIRVVMPKYRQIPQPVMNKMMFLGYTFVDLTWRHEYCGIFTLEHDGVPFYFLDNEHYFYRDWYYGQADDGERFTFFCKAALEVLPVIGFKPYIIHCNDWQAGLVSLLLDAHYRDYRHNGFYKTIHTVMTIHNLKYQGVFPKEMMDEIIGLSWEYFHPDGIEFHDKINFLKAGIAYSTRVTTVSKAYAEEIKTDFYGENLSGIIRRRSNDLSGIVNGIDYENNDPKRTKKYMRILMPTILMENKKTRKCCKRNLALIWRRILR